MTDRRLRKRVRVLGRVLKGGSLLSAFLLMVGLGLGLTLAAPAAAPADWLLRLGLIVLLCTPVARVVVSVYQYAVEGDWIFVALTLAVLSVLLASFVVGGRF